VAFQCRRCPRMIIADETAHIVRGVFVCGDCLGEGEVGYRDGVEVSELPVAVPGDDIPVITKRGLRLLDLADLGDVTRVSNQVSAYDRLTGSATNSKGLIDDLRRLKLVRWERKPLTGYRDDKKMYILRLTPLGMRVRDFYTHAPTMLKARLN
jgi:hypothetical protein